MAALKSQSGEMVEASLRPIAAEEMKAAEGWPELQLEPASWIEGDQVWVLELQPYDSLNDDRHQLTSDGEEIAKPPLCQSEAPGPNPLTPVSLQGKNPEANACETLSQKSTKVTRQNPCIKNQHICPHCGKGYRWPSDLARHQRTHHDTKTTKHKEHLLEAGKSTPKAKLMTNQNTYIQSQHSCNLCEKVYRWRCDLLRHQRVHHGVNTGRQSEKGSLVPVSFREDNTFVSDESTFRPKSKLTTNKNTSTQNLYICDQCGNGYQWSYNLVRHQRVHHGIETGQQRGSPSQACTMVSASLQKNNTFVSEESMLTPNLNPMADQSTSAKKPHICHLCGKGSRWPSELARHQEGCYRRKTAEQIKHQSEVGPYVSPEFMFSQNSKQRTNQNTVTKNLYICDLCGKSYKWRRSLVRHQQVHHSIKTRQQRESLSQTSALASVSFQEENTFLSAQSMLRSKSNPMAGQNTHAKNTICHFCGKGFRWPSELARHQDGCYRRMAAEQVKHQSEADLSVPVLYQHQEKNTLVSSALALRPKPKLMTKGNTHINNLHICDYCGMGYQWLSHLTLHQSVHHGIKAGKRQPRGSPLVSLQEKKTFVSAKSVFPLKSKPMTRQSPRLKKQHICPHCGKGFQRSFDFDQHQRLHCSKTTKQRECPSEANQLLHIPLSLKEWNRFASRAPLFRPKSDEISDQSTCKNHLLTCGQGRRAFQCPSELTFHDRCVYTHSGEKESVQNLHRCDHSGKSFPCPSSLASCPFAHFGEQRTVQRLCQSEAPLQVKSVFPNSPEICSPTSMQTADQSTHPMIQHTCEQYQNGVWWPLESAQHPCMHSGGKETLSAGWGQFCLKGGSTSPLMCYLQKEYFTANFGKMSYPDSQLVTDWRTRSNTCGQCGKACQWPPVLDQHQHESLGVELAKDGCRKSTACISTPTVSIPLSHVKDMLSNSEQMGDQSIETQNLHISSGSETGFQSPRVSHHPCVHTRGDQCRSKANETCLSMSVKTSLQVISTFANCPKGNNQNPKQMADGCVHFKKPNRCDNSEESFQCPSEHTQYELEHTNSRERPYSCAVCGSRFTRKVQLVKHLRLHQEMHDSDGEEEDGRHQGGCVKDISAEHLYWLSHQGMEGLCTPFDSSKADKHDGSPTAANNSCEPPPNSIWEIGASGQPYILSLGQFCECDNCVTYDDSRTIDGQSTEDFDDTASSDLGVCDISPLKAFTDEKVEDMQKIEGSPTNPNSSSPATLPTAVVNQNLKDTPSLRAKQDLLVNEDKPYACPVCLKLFLYKGKLIRHLVVHQKTKPHKCKTCGKCFAHRTYLLKHKKRH